MLEEDKIPLFFRTTERDITLVFGHKKSDMKPAQSSMTEMRRQSTIHNR